MTMATGVCCSPGIARNDRRTCKPAGQRHPQVEDDGVGTMGLCEDEAFIR